jgi:hypothetical protein
MEPVSECVAILRELDLGQYTLFLMSDGGIDLIANDEHTPYLVDNGLHLDSDETYRLFISLYDLFMNLIPGTTPNHTL